MEELGAPFAAKRGGIVVRWKKDRAELLGKGKGCRMATNSCHGADTAYTPFFIADFLHEGQSGK